MDFCFSSIYLLKFQAPNPPNKGSAVFFSEHWAHSDLHCKCCSHPHIGTLPKHQEDDKEVRNKVFECVSELTIEYGKWASSWLEMHSQRHTLKKNPGEVPRPPPMSGGSAPSHTLPPFTACTARFKPSV